jgi:hypothetical protein
MLQAMSKLTTKSDVLRVVITLLICLALWGIIEAFFQASGARWLLPAILAGLFLLVTAMTANGVRLRAGQLMKGRCPNPQCHGTVHHSDLVPKGMLVCPTCKHRWPEVPGMKFRATGREHA